ncbi:MAG: hypothetical protein RSA53_05505 [Odoribacter sp.]
MEKEETKEELQETTLPASVTQEILAMWKAKYRRVSSVTVTDGEDVYTGVFHRPDMNTISAVTKMAKTDEIKASNVLFDNCWLGGDEMMKEDAIIKMAAIGILNEMMNVGIATLKNW